ncbi:MAG: hypothetical protein ACXV8X_08505 [Candidatus Angelobacter sp.]
MSKFICTLFPGLLLLACFGCGGGGSTTPTPVPGPQLAGNYSFSLGTVGSIGGFLNTTAGNVTGNIVLSDATVCSVGVFNVFGSIKPGGELALSASAAGASLTLNANVSSDAKAISGGTFTLTGIPGCVANGQATGFQVQDLNGVYSGTLTLTDGGVGTPITWSGALSQKLLNTGFIGLTGGDATLGGIPAVCGFTTSTFSVVGGGFVFGTHSTGNFQGGANGFNFKADATDATAKTLNVSMFVQGGPCAGDTVVGTISRP